MAVKRNLPILDVLRDTLSRMEAYSRPESATQCEVKRALRKRIAELEAAQRAANEIKDEFEG